MEGVPLHLKFPVIWAEIERRKKEKEMRRKGRVKREVSIFYVVGGEFSGLFRLGFGFGNKKDVKMRTRKRVDREKTFGFVGNK